MTTASKQGATGRGRLRALRTLLIPPKIGKLRGSVVVIVGASRGLGLDLARRYADKGCRLAICARDPNEVERARRELVESGAQVFADVCDATDEQQVERFIGGVVDYYGAIDILVTSAATIQVGPFEAMTKRDFQQALSSIFWTTYFPTMAVLPVMRKQRQGRIVHITSFGGKISAPHLLPYSTAKFAATGFSQGLRAAVAHDGIRVTTITPGLLRTGAEVNVPFKGQPEKELAWFSAGVTLPFVSLDSRRAAKRIIKAVQRGDAESTLTWATRIVIVANAIAPNVVSKLLTLQNELLPAFEGGSRAPERGADIAARSHSKLVGVLRVLGRGNAIQHNAHPGPTHVAPDARRNGDPIGRT